MGSPTYIPLATWTASNSSSTSVDFQSIPATMRDIVVIFNAKSSDASTERNLFYRFNADTTGANYFGVDAYAYASGFTSSSFNALPDIVYMPRSGDAMAIATMQIFDYSATDKHKTLLRRFNTEGSPTDLAGMGAHRWANTAAVNRITFYTTSGAIAQGSTISLYGIAG